MLNILESIANIFSMPGLEQLYCITYDSCEGYYAIHTKHNELRFYKGEQVLPYIDLTKSDENAAMLLVQTTQEI